MNVKIMKIFRLLPVLTAIFLTGCVHVIVPIQPEAAGVKTPVSAVAVEFQNEAGSDSLADRAYANLQHDIIYFLYAQGMSVACDFPHWEEFLQKAPPPPRHPKPPIVHKSGCEVRLVIALKAYKKGYSAIEMKDVWGNVLHKEGQECITAMDCGVRFFNNQTGQKFGEIEWSFPQGIESQRSWGLANYIKGKMSLPSK